MKDQGVSLDQQLEERIRRELPHLSAKQAGELAGAVRRLVEVFEPERVYVFGSHARGTAQPDSDVDLLVVVSQVEEHPTYRLAAAAYAELEEFGLPFEVIFMTRERFDSRVAAVTSLPATVVREGRLLYAA